MRFSSTSHATEGGLPMPKAKWFVLNMVLSALIYWVLFFVGVAAIALRERIALNPHDITAAPRSLPARAQVLLFVSVLVNIVLCFFLGTKLKLLGRHWLNFLSVSGTVVIFLLIIVVSLFEESTRYLFMFIQMPFAGLLFIIDGDIAGSRIVTAVFAVVPTLVIWLGMALTQANRPSLQDNGDGPCDENPVKSRG